jgi:hypothetical protein
MYLHAGDVLLVVDQRSLDCLSFGHHFVLQVPTRTARELGYNYIAVAEEVDVEVDVVDGLCTC